MRIVSVCSALIVGLFVAAIGCGDPGRNLPATVPAKGTVTLDGKGVANAAVTFIADTGNYHATAVTDATGAFTLKAFEEKEGAVPGAYKVEVNQTIVAAGGQDAGTEGEGSVNVQFGLPPKYATITTSELTFTIPEGGATDIKLDLKSQ